MCPIWFNDSVLGHRHLGEYLDEVIEGGDLDGVMDSWLYLFSEDKSFDCSFYCQEG